MAEHPLPEDPVVRLRWSSAFMGISRRTMFEPPFKDTRTGHPVCHLGYLFQDRADSPEAVVQIGNAFEYCYLQHKQAQGRGDEPFKFIAFKRASAKTEPWTMVMASVPKMHDNVGFLTRQFGEAPFLVEYRSLSDFGRGPEWDAIRAKLGLPGADGGRAAPGLNPPKNG